MEQLNLGKTTGKKATPIFARHETFHPRYGWLKKGYDQKQYFNSEKDRARVVLGVGKNMVNSIRYWSTAFKVLCKDYEGSQSVFIRSSFGDKLFSDNGWDPYLEEPATLWLLHWNLIKPPCTATAWYFAFNAFNYHSFSSDDLFLALKEYIHREFPSSKFSDSSLKKDINCLLRMYVPRHSSKNMQEDSINCPFNELGLISAYSDSKRYTFNFGNKASLSSEIIVSACLDFAVMQGEKGAGTISISRLLYDFESPGLIFKLTENSLCEAIESISKEFSGISISDTAGMIQFSFKKNPEDLSQELLEKFYSARK